MFRVVILLIVVAVSAGLLADGQARAADVEEWAVSRIEYKNKGGYSAGIRVRYDLDGATCLMQRNDKLIPRRSTTFINLKKASDLNAVQNDEDSADCVGKEIPEGTEVWAKLRISKSDGKSSEQSCQKDKTVFRYHPDGGTVRYYSKGTVSIGNRCRIQEMPETTWDDVTAAPIGPLEVGPDNTESEN